MLSLRLSTALRMYCQTDWKCPEGFIEKKHRKKRCLRIFRISISLGLLLYRTVTWPRLAWLVRLGRREGYARAFLLCLRLG